MASFLDQSIQHNGSIERRTISAALFGAELVFYATIHGENRRVYLIDGRWTTTKDSTNPAQPSLFPEE